jgi:tetratricopeptide (TPR) repeat protein
MHNLSERINDAFKREQWSAARKLITAELDKDPENHWLISRLGTTHYEQKDYKKALRLARKAHALKPDCPLVLWDLAGSLFANGKTRNALRIYRDLIKNGPRFARQKPCGEGTKWMFSLMCDCMFMMAVCHLELGNLPQATRCLTRFVEWRTQSEGGIYSVDDGVSELESIAKKHKKRQNGREFTGRKLDALAKCTV